MMLVATVLPVGGNCFNLLVAQHVVGELQMVCSAGFYVLERTIGAARCRVRRIGVDVQRALECSPMGIAAVDGASTVLQCCDVGGGAAQLGCGERGQP